MTISEFRAKCLATLRDVQKTRHTVTVTKRGKPIAEVHPVSPVQKGSTWLGSMVGEIEFLGDIPDPAFLPNRK